MKREEPKTYAQRYNVKDKETENVDLHNISHRCILVNYGDEEKRCVKCNYITGNIKNKTDSEIIEGMIKMGYPAPDCSNVG
jgi:hypothetical protein